MIIEMLDIKKKTFAQILLKDFEYSERNGEKGLIQTLRF